MCPFYVVILTPGIKLCHEICWVNEKKSPLSMRIITTVSNRIPLSGCNKYEVIFSFWNHDSAIILWKSFYRQSWRSRGYLCYAVFRSPVFMPGPGRSYLDITSQESILRYQWPCKNQTLHSIYSNGRKKEKGDQDQNLHKVLRRDNLHFLAYTK